MSDRASGKCVRDPSRGMEAYEIGEIARGYRVAHWPACSYICRPEVRPCDRGRTKDQFVWRSYVQLTCVDKRPRSSSCQRRESGVHLRPETDLDHTGNMVPRRQRRRKRPEHSHRRPQTRTPSAGIRSRSSRSFAQASACGHAFVTVC